MIRTVLLNRTSGPLSILKQALIPCLMFYIGVAFYIYRDKIRLNNIYAIIFLLIIVILARTIFLNIALLLLLPYILLTFGLNEKQRFGKISILGDWSYGIYLWGFPCQQVVVSLHDGVMNPYENMLEAAFITVMLAIISYYLIEKPFLYLDKKRSRVTKSDSYNY